MATITNTKLYKLLITFTKEEKKEFLRYIESPYFNRMKELCLLYELIDKGKIIDRQRLVQSLYLGDNTTALVSKKDQTRLRNAMSRLLRLAENFIELRELEQMDNRRQLVNGLMKRQLFKHARAILDEGFKTQRKKTYRDAKYFYTQFLLEEGSYMMETVEKVRERENSIAGVIESFYFYFACNVLRFYNIILNRVKVFDILPEHEIRPEIIAFVETIAKQENFPSLAKIDLTIFKLLSREEEVFFYETKRLLLECASRLETTERRSRVNVLLNFCSWKILEGKFEYREKLLSIIEQYLPERLWHTGLYLNLQLFYWHCRNCLELGDIQRAKNFVKDYQQFLNPDKQEDLLSLCHAYIFFHEGDWAASQEQLSRFFLRKEDYYFSLYYRTLLIKLYYEQEEYEPLFAALKALNLYLYKKDKDEITEKALNSYLAIRKYTFELARIKAERRAKRPLEKIRGEIVDFPYLHERAWLLEKVEELEGKF